MDSTTNRLPRGRGYPLKPSALASAIDAAGLSLPVRLTRWDKFDAAFQAHFYPDGTWLGTDGESFRVTCKAASAEATAALRTIIETDVIPSFIKWAKTIEALDTRSTVRREKQTFCYPFPKVRV